MERPCSLKLQPFSFKKEYIFYCINSSKWPCEGCIQFITPINVVYIFIHDVLYCHIMFHFIKKNTYRLLTKHLNTIQKIK